MIRTLTMFCADGSNLTAPFPACLDSDAEARRILREGFDGQARDGRRLYVPPHAILRVDVSAPHPHPALSLENTECASSPPEPMSLPA